MAHTIESATARLTRGIHSAEEAISQALVKVTALMHDAAVASLDVPDAPMLETHTAFLSLNKTVSSLIDAKGQAARTHSKMLEIGREVGTTEECYYPIKKRADAGGIKIVA